MNEQPPLPVIAAVRGIAQADRVWLGVILAIACVLRFINIGASLWYDEIATLIEFVRLPAAQLVRSLASFNNHMLYSLEAKAAIALFGESAWSLRLPAVLFGVAGVAALWWFARTVLTAREANMSALLLAVSYHHIWFSQNARGYTELMFWTVVGTGLFIKGLKQPTWPTWIKYGCVLALAAYTHLSAGFFFVVHGIVYLVLVGTRARFESIYPGIAGGKAIGGFVCGGLLALLLHLPLVPQVIRGVNNVSASAAAEATVSEWRNPVWTLLEIVRNVQGLGPLASIGIPVVLFFFALGVAGLCRRQPLLVAIMLTHIPLTLLCLVVLKFRIWPRYFFVDIGFVFMCVVHGVFIFGVWAAGLLRTFSPWRPTGEALGLLGASIAIVGSLFLLPPNYRHPKQDFVGARNYVESVRGPGESVASIGLASYAFSRYYAPSWQVVDSWQQIQEARKRSGGGLWLVYVSHLYMTETYPDVLARLPKDFELVKEFPGTLGDGTVFVYRCRNVS